VWFEELASGRVLSFGQIARREGTSKRYVERLSKLAFVAPATLEAICQGRQPADLNAETLLKRIDLQLLAVKHRPSVSTTDRIEQLVSYTAPAGVLLLAGASLIG